MILTVLLGLVVLAAVGGCVCVVWAARGGPRWVRAISSATLTASELLRRSNRNRPRRLNGNSDSGGSD